MQVRKLSVIAGMLIVGWLAFSGQAGRLEAIPFQPQNESSESDGIATIDHAVPHISTVPANAGTPVLLSVRERVRDLQRPGVHRSAVLFIHGNTFPAVPGFDLDLQRYSWMASLARAGFDAFALDHTGYGFSPRPYMDDPCNTDVSQQTAILIPRPLAAPCTPSYAYRLATAQSEWDEIDTVVDYIRALRGVSTVDLAGWSRGGWRAASYAAQHPDKVGKLFLLAPIYNRAEPAAPPPLPQPGVPMTVATRAATYGSLWTPAIRCPGQVEDEVPDYVWNATMAVDPVGRTWGPSEGVARVRTVTYWGWNRDAARAFPPIPTLIVSGEFDTIAPTTELLYADLGTPDKQHVRVQCASHLVPWERQAANLHNLSKRFLLHGSIASHRQGMFYMDIEGNLRRTDE